MTKPATKVIDYKPTYGAVERPSLGLRTKPFIVACIPAFNEENRIARAVLLAQKHVDKVIVCDDGSSDLTAKIAKRLGAEVIVHRSNMGYEASLRSLLNRARELNADIIVTLDADGQHNSEYIPKLLGPVLKREADIVIGSSFLGNNSKEDINNGQFFYRAYGKRALNLIDFTEYGMNASADILLKAKEHSLKVAEVPLVVDYDKFKQTEYFAQQGKPLIVACIPAYNEEKTIAKVVLQARKYVDKVIVCDDGSTDMTGDIAERLGVDVIRHQKNMGKGVALKTMFDHVKHLDPDIIVTLDADNQHDPDEIPKILEPIVNKEADAVIGSRYIVGSGMDAPLYRKVGLKILNSMFNNGCKNGVKDTQSGFRAYSKKVLSILTECESKGYGIEAEQLRTLAKSSLSVVEVPIMIRYKGLENTSKKHPVAHGAELAGTALRLIVEERPLLFLGIPGSLLIFLGMMTGTYLLWQFNITRDFSIPIALITLGALFTGVIFLVASLILYALGRLKYRGT